MVEVVNEARSRIFFVFMLILFRVLLDLSYYLWIGPTYAYMGLALKPNLIFMLISYLLLIYTARKIQLSTAKPSTFIVGFLYLISYVPLTSLVALGGFRIEPLLWLTLTFIVLSSLFKRNIRAKPKRLLSKEGQILKGELLFLAVLGFFLVASLILFAKYGAKMPFVSPDVYAVREEYKLSLNDKNAGLALKMVPYILPWLGNIIIPFIIGWSILKRKGLVLVTALLFQLYIFAIAGFKSQFFAVFFVIWILAGVHYFRKRLVNYMTASLVLLLIISNVIDGLIRKPAIAGLLIRRAFFVPAQLYYYYVVYFSSHPLTYLSQSSIFGWLVHYPYGLPIPNLIGAVYFRKSTMSANANLWADSYASFGVAGLFIFAILLWRLAIVIDRASWGKNEYLVYTLLAMPLFTLTNTAFFTTMVTHGGLLSIVLLLLLPKVKDVPRGGLPNAKN